MAQEESPEIKELRVEMRKGRLLLIETSHSEYKGYRRDSSVQYS